VAQFLTRFLSLRLGEAPDGRLVTSATVRDRDPGLRTVVTQSMLYRRIVKSEIGRGNDTPRAFRCGIRLSNASAMEEFTGQPSA
jgi:hypothetical protein